MKSAGEIAEIFTVAEWAFGGTVLTRASAYIRRNALHFALLVLVTLALAINVPLLLGDLPEWTQQGKQLAARWFGGDVDYRLGVKTFPVPNSALTVLIAVLGTAVGFEMAAKLLVIASIWTLGLLTTRLAWRLDPENAQAKSIVILGTLVLSSSLFNGYLSYQIGLCLLLGYCHWALVREGRSFLGTTLFGVAIFYCHGAVFAVFGAIVLAIAMKSPKRWTLLGSLALPCLLAVAYLYGQRTVPVDTVGVALMKSFGSIKGWILYKGYTFAKLGPFHNFELADGTPMYSGRELPYLAGIATNLVVAVFLAVHTVRAFARLLKGQRSPVVNSVAYSLFAVVGLSLLLPPSIYNLVNPGERLLAPAISLVVLLPGIRSATWKPVAGLVGIWLCATALFYVTADTRYERVTAERKSYLASSGPGLPADSDQYLVSGESKRDPLFMHYPYRFYYIYRVMRTGEIAKLSFDTGLFYIRPGLEHVPSIHKVPAGGAYTPAYLALPTPRGAGLANALWAVEEAKARGWDGIVVGLGTFSDPDDIDMGGLKSVVEAAAQRRLKTHLRLLQPADAEVDLAGVTRPSRWATRFNGGQPWPQPYRLPKEVGIQVAKLVWQKGIDTAVQAYRDSGLKPSEWISAEAANEVGIGGANGPGLGRWSALRGRYSQFKRDWKTYLSTGDQADYDRARAGFLQIFPESLWKGDEPSPEGTIEPEFFGVLRAMLESLDDRGIKIFPLTFEGERGESGQTEIDSYAGTDVAWIAQRYGNRAGFNAFMTTTASTAEEAGDFFAERAQYQIERMRKNRYLTGELFNTEFGMENRPSLISGYFDIAEARQAVLNSERTLRDIVGGGYFISFGNNRLSEGFNLFDQERRPVGRFIVGPNPALAQR